MSRAKDLYTSEAVLAMAPDAASAKNGSDLANSRKWQNLGAAENCLWGECQGSGSKPYQTRIDLGGPAFKCSCPSRKFPCKHGLALLLLALKSDDLFSLGEPPDWVTEWLEARDERAVKKKEKEERPKSEEELQKQEASKEKRKQGRIDNVESGIDELVTFMKDVIRQGTAQIQSKPVSYFQERAARLIDAQAPGLANRVIDLSATAGGDWQGNMLAGLGQLFLICKAFEQAKNNAVPELLKHDIYTAIGFNQSQEELLKNEENRLDGLFCLLGQTVTQEDRLRVQRSYFYHIESGNLALVLDFAHGISPFARVMVPGSFYQASLVYFKSSTPLRALIKDIGSRLEDFHFDWQFKGETVESARHFLSRLLSENPFIDSRPIIFSRCRVFHLSHNWWLRDKEDNHLPIKTGALDLWPLAAFSGGAEIDLLADFDGQTAVPILAAHKGEILRLEAKKASL